MKPEKPGIWLAAPAAAAAALYLSLPSARYNFDGVACAIAVELSDFKHLVHGNHPAYGLLGWAWFSLWKVVGYTGPAVQSLQVLSSLLAAAGVGACALMLSRAGLSPALAAAGAAGLAVSKAYWSWSLEAQVYPLGCACLFMAAAEALRERPSAARVGAWHAGAVLGHVGNAMFFPAACWMLRRRAGGERRDWRPVLRYAAVLAAAVGFAYAAAATLFVRPASWGEAGAWLLGSAALNVQRKFQWVGGLPLAGLPLWTATTLRLFGGGAVVGLSALIIAARGAGEMWAKARASAQFLLLWLCGYLLLFTAWHPGQNAYRLTDLAPLWGFIAYGVVGVARQAAPRRSDAATKGLAAMVLALGAWNLAFAALPGSDPARNEDLARALWVGRETPESAWVVVDGIDQVYIPYFAHRRPLNVHYFENRPDALRARINDIARSGGLVFAVPQALGATWRDWLSAQRVLKTARRGDESLDLVPASPGAGPEPKL